MWPAANPFNIMSTEEAKELLKAGKRRLGGQSAREAESEEQVNSWPSCVGRGEEEERKGRGGGAGNVDRDLANCLQGTS